MPHALQLKGKESLISTVYCMKGSRFLGCSFALGFFNWAKVFWPSLPCRYWDDYEKTVETDLPETVETPRITISCLHHLLGREGPAVITEAVKQTCLYFISQSYKLLSVWLQLRPSCLWIPVKMVLVVLQHFYFPGIILSKCAAENGVLELVLEPAEVQMIDWVLYSKGLSFIPHRMLNGTCIYKNEGLKQPRPSTSHFSVEEKHFRQTACGRKKKFHHGRNEMLSCVLKFKEQKLFSWFSG